MWRLASVSVTVEASATLSAELVDETFAATAELDDETFTAAELVGGIEVEQELRLDEAISRTKES